MSKNRRHPIVLLAAWALIACSARGALAQRAGGVPFRAVRSEPAAKINLNTCRLDELQDLPGVGASLAARIMAGRPYESFDDLARRDIPLSTIEQIRPLVALGRLVPNASPLPNKQPKPDADARVPAPIDLNTASAVQLQSVLGIRPAMAHWIVSGRPYRTVDDLAETGIPPQTLDNILLLVMARQVTILPPKTERSGPESLPPP